VHALLNAFRNRRPNSLSHQIQLTTLCANSAASSEPTVARFRPSIALYANRRQLTAQRSAALVALLASSLLAECRVMATVGESTSPRAPPPAGSGEKKGAKEASEEAETAVALATAPADKLKVVVQQAVVRAAQSRLLELGFGRTGVRLRRMPSEAFTLHDLKVLALENNGLTSLPAEIRSLTALEELWCATTRGSSAACLLTAAASLHCAKLSFAPFFASSMNILVRAGSTTTTSRRCRRTLHC
jgi:hypothetical protein